MKFPFTTASTFLLCLFISTSSCEQPAPKKPGTTKKIELMEGEMPPPPTSVVKSKAVDLETWFFTFANTSLDNAAVRYQIGMFDVEEAIVLAVKRVNNASKNEDSGYTYFKVLKEPSEKKEMMTTVEELQAKVADIRSRLKSFAKSERFRATAFARAESVTFVFDDEQSIVLGK